MERWFTFLHMLTTSKDVIADFELCAKHGHIFRNLIYFCFFFETVSLCSLAVLNLPCIYQGGCELTQICLPLTSVLGLKTCQYASVSVIFLAIK